MKVIIIGGGIGGLTAALSMHAAGIDVEVFEGVAEIRPLGVGINCLPHAVRELTELGLGEQLADTGVATRELVYTNRHGQRIWQEDRGRHAGYHWPQYSIHRGRLQAMLLVAAIERLGRERIHLDHALERFEQDADGVTAHFVSKPVASGSSHASSEGPGAPRRPPKRGHVRADLLIGADGIHSAVRRALYPDEGLPIWNGAILWRGVTFARPFLSGASMIMAGYEWQKFVCYPISAPRADGLQEINWIAELKYRDRPAPQREDWNRQGRLEDFLPKFESWDFGWLDAPGLIRGADRCFEFPMVDRDPLARWTHDRVTLLGDAAHPMYPIGSNGASQAILDARVLSWRLATERDPLRALQLYDEERRPATGAIVMANRRNGPEKVMQMAQERAPDGFADVHEVISAEELAASAREYKLVAGFDREQLNTRPSYSVTRR
ncbi:MAG TPA: flavin-dependent oxidoreductase [Quisquiliibacterium sp.]|nr:flavin-dependent oxidoreductase [Quisquiliibacterium sp.]